ncbi:MAG: LytR/AlgR family response regulator transcription factor [Bacteroidota bacterium]
MANSLSCIVVEDDPVAERILTKYIDQTPGIELRHAYDSAEPALESLKSEPCDVLFLDIELPKMRGTDLLEQLETRPMVVFVTSDRDYALDAFQFNAVDFLLKPLEYDRFMRAVERIKELVTAAPLPEDAPEPAAHEADSIFVRHNSKYVRVELDCISWVEAIGDYVQIYTKDRRYTVHSTMKAMDQKLPKALFQRVHRSYIIRMDAIQEIEDNTLVLPDGKLIPIGKSYRNGLLERLNML